MLRGVRTLLHDEGYTIKGVQKLHKDLGVRRVLAAGQGEDAPIEDADLFVTVETVDTGARLLGEAARDRLGPGAGRPSGYQGAAGCASGPPERGLTRSRAANLASNHIPDC